MNGDRFAADLLAVLTRLVTGVRARWSDGVPDAAQRVYFANHSSHLDALVVWASLPPAWREQTRPVAAADYWDRPGPRRWLALRVLRALPVERSGGAAGREALHRLVAALDAGDSLILFPEGTRGEGGSIGELRPGLYHVAHERPDLDLIPVYLENLSRILPKGEYLPVPLIATATFGGPLRLHPGESRADFLQRARESLLRLGTRR